MGHRGRGGFASTRAGPLFRNDRVPSRFILTALFFRRPAVTGMDDSCAMRVLRDVRVKGYLDYSMVMRTIMEITGSQQGSFFQLVTRQFACKYTSDPAYTQDKLYSFEDLPENQLPIVVGSDTMAIICCEEFPAGRDNILFHDIVSVGVVLTKARESGNTLHLSVCQELGNLLSSAIG